MGILLWMWLVLAFPVALLIDMLMTPKGNRDADTDRMAVPEADIQRQRQEARGAAALARDSRLTSPQDEEDINRQREQDRIRMANRGGRHAPAE